MPFMLQTTSLILQSIAAVQIINYNYTFYALPRGLINHARTVNNKEKNQQICTKNHLTIFYDKR